MTDEDQLKELVVLVESIGAVIQQNPSVITPFNIPCRLVVAKYKVSVAAHKRFVTLYLEIREDTKGGRGELVEYTLLTGAAEWFDIEKLTDSIKEHLSKKLGYKETK